MNEANYILIAIAAALAVAAIYFWRHWRRLARADFIRHYRFPPGLFDKLSAKRPSLGLKEQQLVARALRQFFLAYLNSGRQFVAMPSQVADDLWHEFILYTRHYDKFCKQAFGRFLHHTPAVVLDTNRRNNIALRRTWWYACFEENLNPRRATRLPLLFALDAKLDAPDGFIYELDCRSTRKERGDTTNSIYCGGDFADSNAAESGFDFSGSDGVGDARGCSGGFSGGDGGCGGGGD